jgi:hypothetical protein
MILISSNMHNCNQTISNHILLLSNNLDTLKCGQLQSTTSNHSIKSSSIPSKMHKCTQPFQITIQMRQIYIQALQKFKSTLTTSNCALVHIQCCIGDTPTQNVPHFQMHCKRKSGIVDHRPFSIASL